MTAAPTEPSMTTIGIIEQLRNESDPAARTELAERYGIHTDRALGIPMRRLKEIAGQYAPNHELADGLWESGIYEARTVAAFVDDPASVDIAQMDRWCADFDNWAIVDTVCFHLFDKAPAAWSRIEPWAKSNAEFVKRAGFALLWALALHDKKASDQQFLNALELVELNAGDSRHLVAKSQIMALRAIAQKRPAVRPDVVALARRLAGSDAPEPRRIGRPILKAFADVQDQ